MSQRLSIKELELIDYLTTQGIKATKIAEALGRDPTTIRNAQRKEMREDLEDKIIENAIEELNGHNKAVKKGIDLMCFDFFQQIKTAFPEKSRTIYGYPQLQVTSPQDRWHMRKGAVEHAPHVFCMVPKQPWTCLAMTFVFASQVPPEQSLVFVQELEANYVHHKLAFSVPEGIDIVREWLKPWDQ